MNDKNSNNIRKTIPCNKLYQLYVNEVKADAEIASMFKVSKNSVYRRRQDCDIPTRQGLSNRQFKKIKIRLDRERLRHLYVDQQKNEKEIATIMGCDYRIVKRNLSDYGIKIRHNARLHDIIDKDSLRRMYEVDRRTDASIAKEFSVSNGSVHKIRKRYGIQSRMALMRSRVKDADLKGMYQDNHMPVSYISNKLDCNESVIYDRLKALGIPLHEDHSKERIEYLKWCNRNGPKCKQETKSVLGGRCHICHRTDARQFHIHHMCYMPDDVIYDNYKVKNEYYIRLHPVVMRDMWRFRLLCGTCHGLIGQLSTRPVGQRHLMIDILRIMDEKRYVYPTKYEDL